MARRKAFTLIELLVVISIIAVLMSIMMPALGRARESAKTVLCGSHLKQISMTWYLYSEDYNGKLGYCSSMLPASERGNYPLVNSWTWGGRQGWADPSGVKADQRLLYPYIKDNYKLFACAADKGNAGGWGGKKNFDACGNSYGMADSANRGILGYKIHKIARPSKTIMCFDATVYNKIADDFYKTESTYWHPNGSSNLGMVDGSYQTVKRELIESVSGAEDIPGFSWGFLPNSKDR